MDRLRLSEEKWKERLSPQQFNILRKGGTEPPFNNAYFDNKRPGTYKCAGCLIPLFSSECKYDSGTGWPSFWAPIDEKNVTIKQELATSRDEVKCKRCEGHLGHVFDDGPPPTGKRYCMNSAALTFVEKNE